MSSYSILAYHHLTQLQKALDDLKEKVEKATPDAIKVSFPTVS